MDSAATSEGCAYCGAPATTRDHVPPKGLFPRPLPSDLITVPSCARCNLSASTDDELFRVAIALRKELDDHPIATQVTESVLRGLRRAESQGFRSALVRTLHSSEVVTPAGLILGSEARYSVPLDRIIAVAERITLGLHYHHHKERLPSGYSVTSRPTNALSEAQVVSIVELAGSLSSNPKFESGAGAFKYRFGYAQEDPNAGLWVFGFYDTISFISMTGPDGVDSNDAT